MDSPDLDHEQRDLSVDDYNYGVSKVIALNRTSSSND